MNIQTAIRNVRNESPSEIVVVDKDISGASVAPISTDSEVNIIQDPGVRLILSELELSLSFQFTLLTSVRCLGDQ